MTTNETAKAVGGVVVSAASAIVSHIDHVEQWSRILASWVAIVSGVVVIWSVLHKHIKRRKFKK
jgi:divalent metal cation (Fe/Co/Zn/Cd) transporter